MKLTILLTLHYTSLLHTFNSFEDETLYEHQDLSMPLAFNSFEDETCYTHIRPVFLRLRFQFLWGWNARNSCNQSRIDPFTFNSFEDETCGRGTWSTLVCPPFNSFEDETSSIVSLRCPLDDKAFNSFEDETEKYIIGYQQKVYLSIPLRMKLVYGVEGEEEVFNYFQFLWGWNITRGCLCEI